MRRNRKTRSSERRNQLSVSLFPFLAVLICTLGVLIMLLVMAVKAADDQVRQTQTQSDENQLAQIEELETAKEIRLAQVDGLEMVRPEALDRLSESRANRSHIEEQIRKLKKEAHRVGQELLELDRETKRIAQLKDPMAPELSEIPIFAEVDHSENQRAIEELESQIVLAQERLQAKRDSAEQNGPSRYAIVPHTGGGGTFRRPIFMECTADAITLRPSGIRLAKSEFVPPLEPGNMLDSALLTIREYWQRYDLAGDQGAAYPLIVVRPGGAQTFALARYAMKSWDDEFGYELVESEKLLEFGDQDQQLQAEVRESIREARVRQQQRLASARYRQSNQERFGSDASGRLGDRRRGGSKRNLRPGLVASGTQGGFVSNAAQLENEDSEFGFGDQGDSYVSAASGASAATDSPDAREVAVGETDPASDRSQHSQERSSDYESQQQTDSSSAALASSSVSSNASNSKHAQSGDAQFQNPYADKALAKERGSDWALPTQTQGATGYVRPIRVVCHRDALEVVNGWTLKRIPMTGDTANVIDPLVDEVWSQIDQWGIPGANAYWKPELRFRILEGGNQRFLELKGLLYKSGLTLTPQEQQR